MDAILSYSQCTLHSTTLCSSVQRLREAGVRNVLNASPLSMGLFRSTGPPSWHPANPALREQASQCAKYCSNSVKDELPIECVATSWSLSQAKEHGIDSTVIGCCKAQEVLQALDALNCSSGPSNNLREKWKACRAILAPSLDQNWTSP